MNDFSFFGTLQRILAESGFAAFLSDPRSLIMIVVACILLYLGIGKKFEPLLLVPIAFGILLANFPLTGMLNDPVVAADGSVTSPVSCGSSIKVSARDLSVDYLYGHWRNDRLRPADCPSFLAAAGRCCTVRYLYRFPAGAGTGL